MKFQFREENEVFKQKLQRLFDRHNNTQEQQRSESPAHSTSDALIPYMQFTDEIFNNFRNQLQLLSQVSENDGAAN